MPFVKVNKANAWTCWQEGLITGGNANLLDLDQTYAHLAAKGINALRVWINYNDAGYWLVPSDYVTIGNGGWDQDTLTTVGQRNPNTPGAKRYRDVATKIQSVLDNCASAGIGVILVMNFWGEGGGRMWASRGPDLQPAPVDGFVSPDPYTSATTPEQAQQYLANFWKATADRFGIHKALIGYDILNEPAPGDPAVWAATANRVVAAIRTSDATTPVIVEGSDFGTSFRAFAPIVNGAPAPDPLVTGSAAKKVVFSFHAYAPVGVSHSGLTDWTYESMGMPYPPAEAWNLDTNVKSPLNSAAQLARLFYQPLIDFRNTYKVPVFVGEFSCINQSGTPQYYETDRGSPHRLATRIQATGQAGKFEIVMGRLDQGGFRIDCAPEVAGTYAHKVRLTVSPLPADLRDPRVDTANYTGSNGVDGWDQIVTKLGIVDQEVTIQRAGRSYIVQTTSPTPGQALPADANTPVALISLKPALAYQAVQDTSRATFARQHLRMFQDNGFSWAWHSMDNGGPLWWRPSASVLNVLRSAAMGRQINA